MNHPAVPFTLTVVVCTHNRAALLPRCLEALQRQEGVTPDALDLVVVDNGSTDGTRKVVEPFCSGVIPTRYVFEPTLGLSVARNTGLREARASLVAYVDDDAFAEPQWAASVLSTFATADGRLAVVAGRVFPEWEVSPPDCMTPYLEALYTVHDRGDEPRLMQDSEYFVGANMIFRRDVLLELGGFEAKLGRVGTSLLSNEETYLRDRLAALGYRCAYAPQAVVHHHIGKDRLTPGYIRRRLLAQGESDVVGASLTSAPRGLAGRLSRCLLDAARVLKHTVRSWCQQKERAVYSRQLAVVSIGRFQASLREVWRPTKAYHG